MFCEPFQTASLAIDDKVILPLDQGSQWKPIWWDNLGGKVTLAGDAAHSMLPRKLSLLPTHLDILKAGD